MMKPGAILKRFLGLLRETLGRWRADQAPRMAAALAYYTTFSIGPISLMFKVVPDAKTRWNEVWLGGGLTAFFFVLGKILIGLYLGKSGLATRYGAAGSLVIFLAWIYYSAQIFLAGAEFTRTLAERHRGAVRPAEDAQPISIEKVASAPGRK